MTTCLEYFHETILSVDSVDCDGERITLSDHGDALRCRKLLDKMLSKPTNVGDGSTFGSILDEMPVDSTCGSTCKQAIDQAAQLVSSIRIAFGFDNARLIVNIADAAVDACLCFIRG